MTDNNWLVRAALAAVHTMVSSNMGYHPDTPVDNYETPLSFEQMMFLHTVHLLLFANGVSIENEIVEKGAWIVILSIDDRCDLVAESGIIFGEDDARLMMLHLRDETMKHIEIELNEGRESVLERKDTLISATNAEGTEYRWTMVRLAEPFEQKPYEVPDADRS